MRNKVHILKFAIFKPYYYDFKTNNYGAIIRGKLPAHTLFSQARYRHIKQERLHAKQNLIVSFINEKSEKIENEQIFQGLVNQYKLNFAKTDNSKFLSDFFFFIIYEISRLSTKKNSKDKPPLLQRMKLKRF